MKFRGKHQPTPAELRALLEDGARLVFFEYCISIVFLTLRRPSRLHILKPGQLGFWAGVPYSLLSLCLGWWGLPWGLIYTPIVLASNLQGGVDISEEVFALLANRETSPADTQPDPTPSPLALRDVP